MNLGAEYPLPPLPLVDCLREQAEKEGPYHGGVLLQEAADEIERLRNALEQMRRSAPTRIKHEVWTIARDALALNP